MKEIIQKFKPGARSLKTQLAIYFIPVALLPAVGVSLYATRAFEQSNQETLSRRASSERDAIISEVDSKEKEFLNDARSHSKALKLYEAFSKNDLHQANQVLNSFRPGVRVRLFNQEGKFWTKRNRDVSDSQIPYISKEGLRRVRAQNETVDRYLASEEKGLVTVIRILLKDKDRVYGILEEESVFGQKEFTELKNKRGCELLFLSRDFGSMAGSFSLSKDELEETSKKIFRIPEDGGWTGSKEPTYVHFPEGRYAVFLYDMPAAFGKLKRWGYVGIFLSMNSVDSVMTRLRANLVYVTLFLILAFAAWIFIFANRIVQPVEKLVLAMKRIKNGRVEEIPTLESPYEIQYLIHAFNDMGRNVVSAKRALEQKVEELRKANQEIKSAQTQLVHSAKMISLGQIVAGVAHELNNPIGSIHSNMQSLDGYIEKIKRLIEEYHSLRDKLTSDEKNEWLKLERELDIEFILHDIGDLTKSCLDGARRTRDIVSGLRTFSRMDTGSFRSEDIHTGLLSTLKLLEPEFKNRITVHKDLGQLPQIECNLQQLNQVFVNLLSNAAHAIKGQGDVWVKTRVDGENVVIEIRDSGSGIAKENVNKVFDPFFTTKKVGEGTGLGLSIAYGLIQKHKGNISVSSVVGSGSVFTVILPVKQSLSKAS